jgi:hypothetical protein
MADLVIKDKAVARLQKPDIMIGRYYPLNEALMQFL